MSFSRYSTYFFFLAGALSLNLESTVSFTSLSSEQIVSLKNAKCSVGLKVGLLKREYRENVEWVTLIGHFNQIASDDARLVGEVIKMTLHADPDCIISGECTSLRDGLTYVETHMGQNNLDEVEIIDIEDERDSRFARATKRLDRVLGGLVGVTAGATAILTGLGASVEPPSAGHYLNPNSVFSGAEESCYYVPTKDCVISTLRHWGAEAINQLHVQQQQISTSFDSLSAYVIPSFVTASACVLTLGMQKALRWICPTASIPLANEVADAIVSLLQEEEQIVSLVEYGDFDDVKIRLEAMGFTTQDFDELPVEDQVRTDVPVNLISTGSQR